MRRLSLVNIIFVYFYTCLNYSCQNRLDEDANFRKKSVIVFGGNGFLGAATVDKLLREDFYVVIINRGTWYWDSETRIKPYVTHLKCDRMDSLQNCNELQYFIWSENSPSYFDYVIDFSGYNAFQVADALTILRGKIMKYIYISSDSVYEVSNKTHNDKSREEDSVRPISMEERERLKQKDGYGHRKLECEEELLRQSLESDLVPYIILRLPDVIGPRDNTFRWWLYQLWVNLNEYLDRKLSVPRKFLNQPMSFVFVDDVADAILNCTSVYSELSNEIFNLAQDEMPTLVEFLHILMDSLEIEDISISEDDSENPFFLFPSVTSGPVDTSKAKMKLGWKPTPWHDVVDITVSFYENAMKSEEFPTEKNDVITTLQQHFSRDPSKVLNGLQNKYNLNFGVNPHEEL